MDTQPQSEGQISALSLDSIRTIIRAHPTIFAAMSGAGALGTDDSARAISVLIMENPALVDSIVAAGMNIPIEAAAKMGLMKWLVVANIVQRTATQIDPATLLALFLEELGPLSQRGGAALQ